MTTAEASTVAVIDQWSGWHATALRKALRMTNESFAEHLGVAVRTVAKWNARPERIPSPALQEVLDAALFTAAEPTRTRFALLTESSREVV